MAEFCSCGSIMINGECTNKNCSNKPASKVSKSRTTSRKASGQQKTEPKSTKTRRASKCITYNLYDLQKKEEENTD